MDKTIPMRHCHDGAEHSADDDRLVEMAMMKMVSAEAEMDVVLLDVPMMLVVAVMFGVAGLGC